MGEKRKLKNADPMTRERRSGVYLRDRSELTPAQNRRLRKKDSKAMTRG